MKASDYKPAADQQCRRGDLEIEHNLLGVALGDEPELDQFDLPGISMEWRRG